MVYFEYSRQNIVQMALRVEGFAIVSEDGMIADSRGVMPSSLLIDTDQEFLSHELDRAALLVHGRNSHENQPNSPKRRRLIATRSVETTAVIPNNPLALLWNTSSISLDEAASQLGVLRGTAAILGGTEIYGLFLSRYDAFNLSRVPGFRLPGGRPVFPMVPENRPEDVLIASGLKQLSDRTLDSAQDVTMTTWSRA